MLRLSSRFIAVLAVLALAVGAGAAEIARIDLNKASLEQLTSLPRVGPAIAQRVVEYRDKNGGFRRVEDLLNVRGIGQKTFEMLRDKISVAEPQGKAEPRPQAPGGVPAGK